MKTTSKRTAAFLAAILLCSTAASYNPVRTPIAGAMAPSVRDFAERVLHRLPEASGSEFESLCFSRDSKTLFRDGEEVSGGSFSGFKVISGELRIAASETARSGETAKEGWLSLEEAAPLIGLETYETEDGLHVSSPFRSGTLLVKSTNLPESAGEAEVVGGYGDLHVLQYPTAADAYAAYQRLQAEDSVAFAEPNRIYHIAAEQAAADDGYQFPSDNWGWGAIGADSFLTKYGESAADAPQITAAVVDTGLYAEHSWFQGRIAEGGASFVLENNGSYDDLHGHGTHCAGIICGMTPENVKILPLKVLNSNGYGDSLGIYCAMLYAAEQNADVVSMSLGGLGRAPIMEEAVRVLTEKEIPCVVAAGNDAYDARYDSPANIPEVITVSSVSSKDSPWYHDNDDDYYDDDYYDDFYDNHDDYDGEYGDGDPYDDYFDNDFQEPAGNRNAVAAGTSEESDEEDEPAGDYWLSDYSNFGSLIDFAAPGEYINSAAVAGPYETTNMSGTSMAAPHVSGCVADILTVKPDLTISEVYDCLKSGASDLGDPGYDEQYGWGMVNIAALDFSASALPKPVSSCAAGTYDEVFSVTLSTPEKDAEIRYTLDGSIPDAETGILYDGGELPIKNTTVLTAVTVKNGERSGCARWSYKFYAKPPRMSPASGKFMNAVTVRLRESKDEEMSVTQMETLTLNNHLYKLPLLFIGSSSSL